MWRKDGGPIDPSQVSAMLAVLAHRGPDGEGRFVEHGIDLGMRRLAVRDVEHGTQPYRSENGQIVAVFNGELYNYPALRRHIEEQGHRVASETDGEVLVHLYEIYGSDMLPRLRGMFAIALWDRRTQRLLLARDHVGQKPLYMTELGQSVAFASELKAFYALAGYDPAVDPAYLSTYLAHRFVAAPHTLLDGVTKLEPGEAMVFQSHHRRQRWHYWQPTMAEPSAAIEGQSWEQRLDGLLSETVADHLTADVPVGVFLSGGLDSSLLTALAVKAAGRPLEAFTAVFPRHFEGYDESAWAERVATATGVRLHRVDVSETITPERIRQLAEVLDEPMADPTALPLDGLARAARQVVTVILSGEGADEIFAGYAGYGEVLSLERIKKIPAALRATWMALGLPGAGAIQRSFGSISQRYRGVGFTFDFFAQQALLRPEWRQNDRTGAMQRYWEQTETLSELQAMQGFDARWFLADDVLVKSDRIGMHHSLEIRSPFCDYRVVDFALRTPIALRRTRREDKVLLRQVARAHLPGSVVHRPKQGFPTPLTRLLAGPLQTLAWDVLTDPGAEIRQWLFPDQVRKVLQTMAPDQPTASRQVYALLVLELWLKNVRSRAARPVNREAPSIHG